VCALCVRDSAFGTRRVPTATALRTSVVCARPFPRPADHAHAVSLRRSLLGSAVHRLPHTHDVIVLDCAGDSLASSHVRTEAACALFAFRSNATRELVYYCRLCGVAWPSAPVVRQLNTVFSLEEAAPAGIALLDQGNLADLKRRGAVREVEYRLWQAALDRFLTGK
jgi:hypothetical protein